ncbi:collagen-like domain-containing protein [Snuella sedimenti]|uniref:Collagen-like protein n=1 Tax=Snuella sedimenti TaxID=2798802 RepID=A0A8J7J143_9FLAO|nr:collagen-like protein [Snuella sedimenti]MBJ6367687.1 collagen-like protein [Snuella sedimenti]
MNYQAIVRNSSDMILADQNVGVQISILQGSPSGTVVYAETQTPTTNANGLFSIEIGIGTLVSGNFSTIDWANNTYFIKTEIDPTGGTSYNITGTSQLASVPYALYAANSGSSTPGPQGIQGVPGNDGADGADGADGDSAYQIWLDAGNTGTETEFLASIVGATGAQGPQGIPGNDGADGANGSDGSDGDSAYQIWLDAGNTGTQADFLASLVGETGAQGPQGIQGVKGDKGDKGDDGAQGIQGVAGNDGADGADGVNGTNGVDGADGDSAYQIWLDAGNTGTEAEFLASLVGATGAQGPQGIPGNDGADGSDATVTITNNLTSTSTTEALSAAQGKVLKDLVDTKVNTTIINDLTTGGTTDALSAEQGKTLENSKAAKANVLELDNTNAFTPDTDYEPATKKYVDDSNTTIINDLTTGGTTDALSAEQGKTLQDSKLDKTLTNTNLLVGNSSNVATSVALSGDATLANDGTLTITDNAINGTDISLTGETAGDMAYFNGTDWVRLPKGTANQSLVMNSGATAPEWQSGGATEDVEVILGSATGGNGTSIAIPANVSDYKYIRLETDNWYIASALHSVHGTVLVSDMANKRILIYADTVYYLHADINASGTSLTINCSGTATWRIVGIKAQKTVLDPSLTTVIDDDTFATASSSNVPSAESVKAYVDSHTSTAYSTAEQLTGRTWIDGKPIYERSFAGNYNASINILTGVDKIITSNISVRYNGSSDWYSGTTSTDDVALIKRATGNVNIAGSGGFNTNDYIIVVTYTKL